jgi:hypothetical protein
MYDLTGQAPRKSQAQFFLVYPNRLDPKLPKLQPTIELANLFLINSVSSLVHIGHEGNSVPNKSGVIHQEALAPCRSVSGDGQLQRHAASNVLDTVYGLNASLPSHVVGSQTL